MQADRQGIIRDVQPIGVLPSLLQRCRLMQLKHQLLQCSFHRLIVQRELDGEIYWAIHNELFAELIDAAKEPLVVGRQRDADVADQQLEFVHRLIRQPPVTILQGIDFACRMQACDNNKLNCESFSCIRPWLSNHCDAREISAIST